MRIALLDTDCAIYAMTAQFPVLRERLEAREPGSVAISAITFAEIAIGSANGKLPDPAVLAAFLSAIQVVAFDEAAGRSYARLPFKRGRFDRLLAAQAISLDAVLVTNNERDFGDIPNLIVENWTK